MNNHRRYRFLMAFASLSPLLCISPVAQASAGPHGAVLTSGNCGKDGGDSPLPVPRTRSAVKSVVIEPGVTSVGVGAFFECTELENVELPEGMLAIKNSAFCYCSSLAERCYRSSSGRLYHQARHIGRLWQECFSNALFCRLMGPGKEHRLDRSTMANYEVCACPILKICVTHY